MSHPDAPLADHGHNLVLAGLDAAEREAIAPLLRRTAVPLKTQLYARNRPMDHVYFPIDAVLSMVADMTEGDTVEVGTVGTEGVLGATIFELGQPSELNVYCQVAGDALVMPTADFLAVMARPGGLQRQVRRYTHALMMQMAHTAACNVLHPIQQRICRWLLMTHDRVGRDAFDITQEYLALMLGVRRAGVTVAAGILQQAGLITYRHGHLRILDRAGLESASCECYAATRLVLQAAMSPAGGGMRASQ